MYLAQFGFLSSTGAFGGGNGIGFNSSGGRIKISGSSGNVACGISNGFG